MIDTLICSWGSHLTDSVARQWARDNCDTVQQLVHVGNPGAYSPVEMYDTPNLAPALSNANVARMSEHDGHRTILTFCWYYGCGRDRVAGEAETPTGWGKYHRDSYHGGGVIDAIKKAAQWVNPSNVIGVKIGNEQQSPPELYADLVRRCRPVIRSTYGAACKVIVGGSGPKMMQQIEAAAPYAEVLDAHLLRPNYKETLRRFQDIAETHVNEIWATEIASIDSNGVACDPIDVMLLNIANAEGVTGMGCFPGNARPDTGRRWNYRRFSPPFTCWSDGRLTFAGRSWERIVSGADPIPEPTPEPEPPTGGLTVEEREQIAALADRLENIVAVHLKPAREVTPRDAKKARRKINRVVGELDGIAES